MSAADAKKTDPSKWPGLNLLGKVLDTLKLEFQNTLEHTNESNIKKKVIDKPIEVCNIYHFNKVVPEDGVYIGRANRNLNLTGSIFANPFAMKDQSEQERTRVITEYKDWLWPQISDNKITKDDLMKLSGKKLLCFCSPRACHGHVLKETVELLINNEVEFDNKIKQLQDIKNKPKP